MQQSTEAEMVTSGFPAVILHLKFKCNTIYQLHLEASYCKEIVHLHELRPIKYLWSNA